MASDSTLFDVPPAEKPRPPRRAVDGRRVKIAGAARRVKGTKATSFKLSEGDRAVLDRCCDELGVSYRVALTRGIHLLAEDLGVARTGANR